MYSLLICACPLGGDCSECPFKRLGPCRQRPHTLPSDEEAPARRARARGRAPRRGQLAHAAAGPGPNDIQDSLPFWDANGVRAAFERTAPGLQHVLSTTSAGKDTYLVYPAISAHVTNPSWTPERPLDRVRVRRRHLVIRRRL